MVSRSGRFRMNGLLKQVETDDQAAGWVLFNAEEGIQIVGSVRRTIFIYLCQVYASFPQQSAVQQMPCAVMTNQPTPL